MSIDGHKALSRRALNMWASGNEDNPDAIFTANYVNHQEPSVAGGIKALDLAAWQDLVRHFHQAFSRSRVDILMQIAEGDLVATHWQFTAVHSGTYRGKPPTGKEITWTGIEIDRFENGRIAESWVNWDKYRVFEEVGLIPTVRPD